MRRASYDSRFYERQRDGSRSSARRILPFLVGWTEPASAVDVGCGVGTWLSVLRDLGVEDVVGIDGDHVDRSRVEIPADRFVVRDLSAPFEVGRTFDLAICLEVAEHVPPERAEGFVASLARLAPVVLFSAAIPAQGGTGHVNERWPSEWARAFAALGFAALDPLRMRVWNDPAVEPCYAQNALVYVRREALARHPALERAGRIDGINGINGINAINGINGINGIEGGEPASLVHPAMWTRRNVEPTLHRAWRDFRRTLGVALLRPFRRRRP